MTNGDKRTRVIELCRALPGAELVDRGDHSLQAHIGPRGWFGLRLDRGRVRWREVAEIIERSYRLTAPKSFVRVLDGARGGRRLMSRCARRRVV